MSESEKTNPGGPTTDPVTIELRRLNKRVDALLKISKETYEEVVALRPTVAKHTMDIEELKARVLLLEHRKSG